MSNTPSKPVSFSRPKVGYFSNRPRMARNNPVIICVTKQIPNSDPKFHQPLIVDGVGKSTRVSFAFFK